MDQSKVEVGPSVCQMIRWQVGKQQTVDGRSPQPFHSCTILLKLVLVGSFPRTICRYVVISDGVIPGGERFVS